MAAQARRRTVGRSATVPAIWNIEFDSGFERSTRQETDNLYSHRRRRDVFALGFKGDRSRQGLDRYCFSFSTGSLGDSTNGFLSALAQRPVILRWTVTTLSPAQKDHRQGDQGRSASCVAGWAPSRSSPIGSTINSRGVAFENAIGPPRGRDSGTRNFCPGDGEPDTQVRFSPLLRQPSLLRRTQALEGRPNACCKASRARVSYLRLVQELTYFLTSKPRLRHHAGGGFVLSPPATIVHPFMRNLARNFPGFAAADQPDELRSIGRSWRAVRETVGDEYNVFVHRGPAGCHFVFLIAYMVFFATLFGKLMADRIAALGGSWDSVCDHLVAWPAAGSGFFPRVAHAAVLQCAS